MQSEDLEFSISQYIDGTLSDPERATLEARLTTDVAAQGLLAEYRALDESLHALPVPPVRWDRLAQTLSAAVAAAEEPAQSYRINFWRLSVPLGLAASLLIAGGVAIHIYHSIAGMATLPKVYLTPPQSVAVVTGPQVDSPSGPVQVQISIGPSKAFAEGPDANRYADDMVVRPSRVLVASGIQSVEDTPVLPY